MTRAFIGLGANLGDAQATVLAACDQLATLPHTQLLARSNLYRTAPVDAMGEDYINAVALLETALAALPLLRALQNIEAGFGRERPFHNAPRTLDLDILLFGDRTMGEADMTVPHPCMTERAFALIPLLEIDPDATLPGLGSARDFLPRVLEQRIEKLA